MTDDNENNLTPFLFQSLSDVSIGALSSYSIVLEFKFCMFVFSKRDVPGALLTSSSLIPDVPIFYLELYAPRISDVVHVRVLEILST